MAPIQSRLVPRLSSILNSRISRGQSAPVNFRLFTQNSQLLLITPVTPRPQLPFLHPLSRAGQRPSPWKKFGQWQISRFLSTEKKRAIIDQIKLSTKYILWSWVFGGLFLVVFFGIQEATLEASYPSPPMWTYMSRKVYRDAHWREDPESFDDEIVDWVLTGGLYRGLLRRLEDPKIDGAGLLGRNTEQTLIDGAGETGLDITDQPYPWRRGYWETLMGTARGAENLDGYLRDDTRMIVFPPELVIGPSNPNPRPVPVNSYPAPLEKDCSPAFAPPQTYYMKALTTKGFTTNERLQAAVAYADWLDFKQMSDTAEEMYKWALDIAMSGLDHPETVVDRSTGVIKPDAPLVSPNILLATTALASHHARTANLSAALPIFLSTLRARRSRPQPADPKPAKTEPRAGIWAIIVATIMPIIAPPPFPPPPPSGNEPAVRMPASVCEEAGLMAYIGEVLYASSSRTEGLTWTRDAVDIAEKEYFEIVRTPDEHEAVQRCQECLTMGLENWRQMVAELAEQKKEEKMREKPASSGWSWSGAKTQAEDTYDWDRELTVVEERASKVRDMLSREKAAKKATSGFRLLLFA